MITNITRAILLNKGKVTLGAANLSIELFEKCQFEYNFFLFSSCHLTEAILFEFFTRKLLFPKLDLNSKVNFLSTNT